MLLIWPVQAISDSISMVERAADQLRRTRGFDVPVARDASLPQRMKTVQAMLHKLAAELDAKERDLSRTQAQMIEAEFMRKLHGQVRKIHTILHLLRP